MAKNFQAVFKEEVAKNKADQWEKFIPKDVLQKKVMPQDLVMADEIPLVETMPSEAVTIAAKDAPNFEVGMAVSFGAPNFEVEPPWAKDIKIFAAHYHIPTSEAMHFAKEYPAKYKAALTKIKNKFTPVGQDPYCSCAACKANQKAQAQKHLTEIEAQQNKLYQKAKKLMNNMNAAEAVPVPPSPPTVMPDVAKAVWKNRVAPRTQKMRGLSALRKRMYTGDQPKPQRLLALPSVLLPDLELGVQYPVFARPCPIRPRHGFVESRLVHSEGQLRKLYEEARAADPEAELMIAPFIAPEASAVFLPEVGVLTLGPGHDGATGGHGSLVLRTVAQALSEDLREAAGLRDTGYMELVYGRRIDYDIDRYRERDQQGTLAAFVTQLRDGPKVEGAHRDFVPADVECKAVVTPCEDLLEWESKVKTLEPGTVVYAPGSSLASHAAVHCIINGVPFVTSFEPQVGTMVTKVGDATPIEAWPADEIRTGFLLAASGCRECFADKNGRNPNTTALFHLASAILHNWSALYNTPEAARLAAFAAGVYIILGAASCWGEQRFASPKIELLMQHNLDDRAGIHEEVFEDPLHWAGLMSYCCWEFEQRDYGSGYGGEAWAKCARETAKVVRALAKCGNRKKDVPREFLGKLVEAVNRCVNLAHNGGWWLNKLVTSPELDYAAHAPGWMLAAHGDVLFKVLTAPAQEGWKRLVLKKGAKLDIKLPPAPAPATAVVRPADPGSMMARFQATYAGEDDFKEQDIMLTGEAWAVLNAKYSVNATEPSKVSGSIKRYMKLMIAEGGVYTADGDGKFVKLASNEELRYGSK